MDAATKIRHVTGEPWLLGWSRWSIELEHVTTSGVTLRRVLAEGRWHWRPRDDRDYREAVYDVGSVRITAA